MKRIYIISFVLFIVSSCANNNEEKKWIEVKESRSIDYYQDYLINNPKTDYFSEIIDSLKIMWEKELIGNSNQFGTGNNLTLLINLNNQLLFRGEPIEIDSLAERIKYSISNPDYLAHLPEKKTIEIDGFGRFEQSRGIIDIKSDSIFDKDFYSQVLTEVVSGFDLIRGELSLRKYGKSFNSLNKEQMEIVEIAIPYKIRIERHLSCPQYLPPKVEPIEIIVDEPEIEI